MLGKQSAFNRLDRKINEIDCRTRAKCNDSNEFSGFLFHICYKITLQIYAEAPEWFFAHYHFQLELQFPKTSNRNRNRNDVRQMQLIQWWLQWCVTIGSCKFQSFINAYKLFCVWMCLLCIGFNFFFVLFLFFFYSGDSHSKRFGQSIAISY